MRSSNSWLVPDESKTQPKEVTLLKDSQSDKYGEVAFNHENHSIKMITLMARPCSVASNVITQISLLLP